MHYLVRHYTWFEFYRSYIFFNWISCGSSVVFSGCYGIYCLSFDRVCVLIFLTFFVCICSSYVVSLDKQRPLLCEWLGFDHSDMVLLSQWAWCLVWCVENFGIELLPTLDFIAVGITLFLEVIVALLSWIFLVSDIYLFLYIRRVDDRVDSVWLSCVNWVCIVVFFGKVFFIFTIFGRGDSGSIWICL